MELNKFHNKYKKKTASWNVKSIYTNNVAKILPSFYQQYIHRMYLYTFIITITRFTILRT